MSTLVGDELGAVMITAFMTYDEDADNDNDGLDE